MNGSHWSKGSPCLIPGHEFSEQLVSQHIHVVQDGEVEPVAVSLARDGLGGAGVLPGLLKVRRQSSALFTSTFNDQTHKANTEG